MRLFHFSDDGGIVRFVPRPVLTPADRPGGQDWLNGPLVWAIEEDWQALYFFPRECPRVLLRRRPTTTEQDLARWWAGRDCKMIAHIEWSWFERLRAQRLYRYDLPPADFEDLGDAGMWVCSNPVEPIAVDLIEDLPAALAADGVELRVMRDLLPLKGVWDTSLHASGIRLRNAKGWNG
jgi:hypothetical protein